MPDPTKPVTVAAPDTPDFFHRIATGASDAVHSVVDTVTGAVHKVSAVQTWTAIAGQLEPVFAKELGPVVVDVEKSLLTLVDPQHLAGYEAAFGSLAASGLKALLSRIPLSVAAAAASTTV